MFVGLFKYIIACTVAYTQRVLAGPYVSLSVCAVSVCLYVCLSVRMSLCLSVWLMSIDGFDLLSWKLAQLSVLPWKTFTQIFFLLLCFCVYVRNANNRHSVVVVVVVVLLLLLLLLLYNRWWVSAIVPCRWLLCSCCPPSFTSTFSRWRLDSSIQSSSSCLPAPDVSAFVFSVCLSLPLCCFLCLSLSSLPGMW